MAKDSLPPSVKPNLIGGHFRMFRKDPTAFLMRMSALGDVSYFRMGNVPVYFVNHPDLVRDVLVASAHKFHKGRALQRAKNLLGEGLLTSEEKVHLRQRRLVQPAFHKQRIISYAEAMTMYADRMANEWNDGEVRDIDHEMMRLTLQIVGRTLFSADVTDDADEVGAAMTTIVNLFNFLLLPFSELLEKLPLPQSIKFRKAKAKLDEVIYGFIDERRASGEDKGDLLSMLLLARDEEEGKDGGGMTDEQVRDECLTLFLAGHETTANLLTWTWYLLSQNPVAESRLHEELDRVLGGRAPAFEDLPALKYTEAVVAESMRLYPPAWVVGRLATEEHEFNGYKVPRGALTLVSQFAMHRDPRFWEDAEEFKPERWEKLSIKETSQRFTYFPFGGGVRRCIGEQFAWTEGILLLATLARKWKLSVRPDQQIGLKAMITLRPKYGMRMKIERRK